MMLNFLGGHPNGNPVLMRAQREILKCSGGGTNGRNGAKML